MVAKTGMLVGIHLRPHDLRRHAATYASRSGVPIEIVSKVILRHANLATTQRYLGKISDVEAMRWIENLYALSARGESISGFTPYFVSIVAKTTTIFGIDSYGIVGAIRF
jgi:hypothetical protein